MNIPTVNPKDLIPPWVFDWISKFQRFVVSYKWFFVAGIFFAIFFYFFIKAWIESKMVRVG